MVRSDAWGLVPGVGKLLELCGIVLCVRDFENLKFLSCKTIKIELIM